VGHFLFLKLILVKVILVLADSFLLGISLPGLFMYSCLYPFFQVAEERSFLTGVETNKTITPRAVIVVT